MRNAGTANIEKPVLMPSGGMTRLRIETARRDSCMRHASTARAPSTAAPIDVIGRLCRSATRRHCGPLLARSGHFWRDCALCSLGLAPLVREYGGTTSVHVIEHIRSDTVVLEPRDEITADNELELDAAVRRHLSEGRVHLVLDLAHVPYIDSCGLGRMVQAYVSAQRKGGGLKLINVNDRNRHLLTVTRLLPVFEVQQP